MQTSALEKREASMKFGPRIIQTPDPVNPLTPRSNLLFCLL